MKLHTRRIEEEDFAKQLKLGEVYAISKTSFQHRISHTLRRRGLAAKWIPRAVLSARDAKREAVYEVISYSENI